MDEIKISIVCIVYNHKGYLREALEGFVSQKTNFAFEALVHDDASTDGSTAIIREYEQRYPDIIKPIYQTENQYSKGRKIILEILVPRAKGKYIAFCEGDDCWIDPYKLQKQYDLLEARQDVDVCIHNVQIFRNASLVETLRIAKTGVELISMEEVITRKRGAIPTASIVLRKSFYDNPINKVVLHSCGGHIMLSTLASLRGGMLCLSDVMSIYHTGVPGSWTERNRKSKNSLVVSHYRKQIEALRLLDDLTERKYAPSLESGIAYVEYALARAERRYFDVVKNCSWYKRLNTLDRIYIWLCIFHIMPLFCLLRRAVPKKLKSLVREKFFHSRRLNVKEK